ncbi:MAG: 1,4-dihydroxy-2-naphthoate octaprenyltransferase [Ignavibacteria bacterium]|nr:1,4-dihydroxy-2-naphthoate octaprenyltransferase [Ignavibacteria bacterium]
MSAETMAPPKGAKLWLMASRAYSFPASIIPVLFGSTLALIFDPALKFNWVVFALTLIGSVLAQVGANLINDIYDYKIGIDKEDKKLGIPHGGSMVLSMNFMTLEQMKMGATVALAAGALIGFYLYLLAGPWIIYLTIFGVLSSIIYTATPAAFKYKALGDIQVFVSFGCVITLGAYIVQTHEFSWLPVLLSLPLGFLIDAILHTNNIRDISFDGKFNVKTLPLLIGESASVKFYYFLIFGAYALVAIFVALQLIPYTALLCLVTLPIGIKLCKMANHFPKESQARYEYGVKHIMMTAQLNMQFGLTMIIGILVYYFFLMNK